MSAPEFFIDEYEDGEIWAWSRGVDEPMLRLTALRHVVNGPALLDLIRAAVEGEVHEEWGVRDEGGRTDGAYIKHEHARAFADAYGPNYTVLRRTVVTGAWEEER